MHFVYYVQRTAFTNARTQTRKLVNILEHLWYMFICFDSRSKYTILCRQQLKKKNNLINEHTPKSSYLRLRKVLINAILVTQTILIAESKTKNQM